MELHELQTTGRYTQHQLCALAHVLPKKRVEEEKRQLVRQELERLDYAIKDLQTNFGAIYNDDDLADSGFTLDACEDVLRLPALENLSIRGGVLSPTDASEFYRHPELYDMPRLKILRLQSSPIMLDALFHIRAPCLEPLILESVSLLDVSVDEFPVDFFLSLRSLTLVDHNTVPIHYWSEKPLSFYHLTQKITRLTVSQQEQFGDWIMQEVLGLDGTTWPHLQVVTLNLEGT